MSYRPRCLLNTAWRKVVPGERWVNSFKELDLQSWKLTQLKVFDCRSNKKHPQIRNIRLEKKSFNVYHECSGTFWLFGLWLLKQRWHADSWKRHDGACESWKIGQTQNANALLGDCRSHRVRRFRCTYTAFLSSLKTYMLVAEQLPGTLFLACSVTRGTFGDVFRTAGTGRGKAVLRTTNEGERDLLLPS